MDELWRGAWHFHDASPLERFMARHERGERVLVASVGGSMTAGVGCIDGESIHQLCAWPNRVAEWFKRQPDTSGQVAHRNLARGGVQTTSFLPTAPFVLGELMQEERVPAEGVLLFLDYSVNDAYTIGGVHPRLADRGTETAAAVHHAAVALEQLIRVLSATNPSPVPVAMVSILHACPPCHWLHEGYRAVLAHYRVPLVDFTMQTARSRPGDSVSALQLSPPASPFWPHDCRGCSFAQRAHPNASWHALYAEAVTWGLSHVAARRNRSAGAVDSATPAEVPLHALTPLARADELSRLRVCSRGEATIHNAYDAHHTTPAVTCVEAEGCVLREDRPGKPGWELFREGARLSFVASFGSKPRLLLSYLQSYEGMGEATMTIGRVRYALNGTHALRTSQVSTEFFLADGTLNQHDGIDNVPEAHLTGRPLGNAGAFGFGLKPNSSNVPVLIQLSSSVGRFKVVSLVSC